MPISITRGYSFDAAEEVTAFKLHRLVDGAVVSGLVFGDSFGVETSSPASIATGKMMAIYESQGFEVSTYTDARLLTYLVYDSAFSSWVAFFPQYGLETHRFLGGADLSAWNPGTICIPDAPNTGFTLFLGNATPGAGFAGQDAFGAIGTATIPTNSANRILIAGFGAALMNRTGNIGDNWPFFLYFGDNQDTTLWQASNTTNLDGIHGIKMAALSGGGTARQPAWLFGGPVMRG